MKYKKNETISKIKRKILEVDNNVEVILFGSRARGEEREDSDWDIIILTRYPVDLRKEQIFRHKLFELELELGIALSTFVFSKSEWENKMRITPLYRNVMEEGISI